MRIVPLLHERFKKLSPEEVWGLTSFFLVEDLEYTVTLTPKGLDEAGAPQRSAGRCPGAVPDRTVRCRGSGRRPALLGGASRHEDGPALWGCTAGCHRQHCRSTPFRHPGRTGQGPRHETTQQGGIHPGERLGEVWPVRVQQLGGASQSRPDMHAQPSRQ